MRLLDLFCGAGGAAAGYHRAGFDEIVGVDNAPQPRYPFTFVLGDALAYCAAHGHEFDAIHASPPCQAYSVSRHIFNREHPKLIGETRDVLAQTGRAWVIENVVGAPMGYSVTLCGTLFGLKVYRHRHFESSFAMLVSMCAHPKYLIDGYVCIYGDVVRGRQTGNTGNKYKRYPLIDGCAAMGIDWMTRKELTQAIPPAYTEYIGTQLLAHLQALAEEA